MQDDEEDTSIFNLGIGLDAAGTDAVFNFGSNTAAGSGGSTFTTHQQQQAEQEAEKHLSKMQVNDLSAAAQTSPTDMVSLFSCSISTVLYCTFWVRVGESEFESRESCISPANNEVDLCESLQLLICLPHIQHK